MLCSLIFSFVSFSYVYADEISLSNLGLSDNKAEKNQKIDWSKPIVSRGFGLDNQNNSDQSIVDQYQSGQVFYFFGEYDKAVEKWLPLLEENFAEAQASMGWLYQAGLGIKKDEKKAFDLYVKAAKQNNAIAQNNLGVMYENGISVSENMKKAIHWYKLSAEQGYRFGQYNYANSLLLSKKNADNFKLAKLYLHKSSDQGVQEASEVLKSLEIQPANNRLLE